MSVGESGVKEAQPYFVCADGGGCQDGVFGAFAVGIEQAGEAGHARDDPGCGAG